LSQLTRPVSLPTRYDLQVLQVRPPFQFFDHTGRAALLRDGFLYAHRADFAEAVPGEEAIGWP
jgi:hypothetical protein